MPVNPGETPTPEGRSDHYLRSLYCTRLSHQWEGLAVGIYIRTYLMLRDLGVGGVTHPYSLLFESLHIPSPLRLVPQEQEC